MWADCSAGTGLGADATLMAFSTASAIWAATGSPFFPAAGLSVEADLFPCTKLRAYCW